MPGGQSSSCDAVPGANEMTYAIARRGILCRGCVVYALRITKVARAVRALVLCCVVVGLRTRAVRSRVIVVVDDARSFGRHDVGCCLESREMYTRRRRGQVHGCSVVVITIPTLWLRREDQNRSLHFSENNMTQLGPRAWTLLHPPRLALHRRLSTFMCSKTKQLVELLKGL